jgi:chromosome segregation ATPase
MQGDLKKDTEVYHQEFDDLNGKINNLKGELDDLKGRLDVACKANEVLDQENEDLKRELDDLNISHLKLTNLEKDYVLYRKRNEDLVVTLVQESKNKDDDIQRLKSLLAAEENGIAEQTTVEPKVTASLESHIHNPRAFLESHIHNLRANLICIICSSSALVSKNAIFFMRICEYEYSPSPFVRVFWITG